MIILGAAGSDPWGLHDLYDQFGPPTAYLGLWPYGFPASEPETAEDDISAYAGAISAVLDRLPPHTAPLCLHRQCLAPVMNGQVDLLGLKNSLS